MTNKKIVKLLRDIESLRIQGASNVALSVINVLLTHLNENKMMFAKKEQVYFLKTVKTLAFVRPTEPLVQNFYFFLKNNLKNKKVSSEEFFLYTKKLICLYKDYVKDAERKIVINAQSLIKKGDNILTHCHSTTVEKILLAAGKGNKKIKIYADETRPLFQGRKTAKNLAAAGLPVTQVADSASGFLISEYSGKDLMMDKIIVGADAILRNGNIINKIGTYDIAVSCFLNKIPFYVAVSLLKYDSRGTVFIERRSDKELWPNHPAAVKILNFAFDQVPGRFISGIITEAGVIKPAQAGKRSLDIYPWLGM